MIKTPNAMKQFQLNFFELESKHLPAIEKMMADDNQHYTILGTETPHLIDFVLFSELDQIFKSYTGYDKPGPDCPKLQGWYEKMKLNAAMKEVSDELQKLIQTHSLSMERAEPT